jgi:hypothetical protein
MKTDFGFGIFDFGFKDREEAIPIQVPIKGLALFAPIRHSSFT